MASIADVPTLTLEEFLALPETKPASEFVDGRIEQRPMPQGKHSRLQLKFCEAVNAVAENSGVAMAFPELRCTFGGRSILPDASVFLWEKIPFDQAGEIENEFTLCPDWIVEILPPEQKATKVIRNILHCLKYGAQLGWLIDPDERVILVFQPGQLPIELIGNESLPLLAGVDLALTVDEVFAWLKSSRQLP
jgi:Uma2 family endonuclease